MRRWLLLASLLALSGPLAAQPLAFGSADDPLEADTDLGGLARAGVLALAGPSYLPDEWRTAVRLDVEAASGRWSAAVGTTLHSGSPLYGPEADEPYDALRALRYARLNPTRRQRTYLRVGPTERQTLGVGALVQGYRTTTAWDERLVGVEAAVAGRRLRLGAFADDVALSGVVGAEIGLTTPLSFGPLRRIGVVGAGVHDLAQPGLARDSSLTGYEVVLRGDLRRGGPVILSPFVAHAGYLDHGGTIGTGLDARLADVGDALRATGRLAVFGSSARFVPGHVGPFYSIGNVEERIVDDGAFFQPDFDPEAADVLVGTPLDSLSGGVDVVLDLRVVAFGRLVASQHIRRHIGDDAASAYSVRLGGTFPNGARAEFTLERQGFRGFFDLIDDLGDENTLLLDVAFPVGRVGYVFVRSRYGYRRLTEDDGTAFAEAAPPRYLVERRFEPLAGVRLAIR
ncbi:MAG: hypothetical protein AAGJ11_09425 [Bacteroidota bacterium]